MTDLTAVNLFAGIEGFGLALHWAGIHTVAAVEIDPAARGVIADRFPDTALFTDVCEVQPDDLLAAGFVPGRGILTGGWPCTDLSLAGPRLGLGGARSGLFWEIVRLLAVLRPRWFCLENVVGLLSACCPCPGRGGCGQWCGAAHPVPGGACGYDGSVGRCMELHGGAMGAVLGALGGLGYGFAYRVLDAQYFGVPQQRRRVVVVGHLGDGAAAAQVLLEPEGGGGDPAPGFGPWEGDVSATAVGAATGCGAGRSDVGGGVKVAVPVGHPAGVAPTLTRHYGRNTPNQEAFVIDDTDPVDVSVRHLTPVERERLQGFPDGWTATSWGRPQPGSVRCRQLGNSVAVPVFGWVARRIVSVDNNLEVAA